MTMTTFALCICGHTGIVHSTVGKRPCKVRACGWPCPCERFVPATPVLAASA